MHNDDLKQLKMIERTEIKKRAMSDPIGFMEYQARYGSYGLMPPKTFMLDNIEAIYKEAYEGKRKDGYMDHAGSRCEYVARQIASRYTYSKVCVRARMIQLGFIAAIGALNYPHATYSLPGVR